jgi:hypothetical protein
VAAFSGILWRVLGNSPVGTRGPKGGSGNICQGITYEYAYGYYNYIWVLHMGVTYGPDRTPIGPGLSPHSSRVKLGLPGNPT